MKEQKALILCITANLSTVLSLSGTLSRNESKMETNYDYYNLYF